MATSSATAGLLARQLKQMQSDKDIPGISCGLADNNVFEWEVMLMISDECKFYGGESMLPTAAGGIPGYICCVHQDCSTPENPSQGRYRQCKNGGA